MRKTLTAIFGTVVATVAMVSMTAGAASAVPIAAVAVSAQPTVAGAVVSVTPARIADSRVNQQITGAVPALGTATVQVTGQGGVPGVNVAAAVLNVTAVDPQSPGYITVWPFGIPVQVPGLTNIGAISAGGHTGFALTR